MALDHTKMDYLDKLADGKKGTSSLLAKIQKELTTAKIGDICYFQGFGELAPSFIEWKMNFSNEVEILLGLIRQDCKKSVFFRLYLSEDIIKELDSSKERLLELQNMKHA